MSFYKFMDVADLRNFAQVYQSVCGNIYRLMEHGIIEKFYAGPSGEILIDQDGYDSYLAYLLANVKVYRLRTEKVKPVSVMPVCELCTIAEVRAVFGSNSGDQRFNHFTKNNFSREEYDTMRVCAIDLEYSDGGGVSEIGFYDIKTNRCILFRLPDNKRKVKPKSFTVANGIEVILRSEQQLFDEACRTIKHYDTIVMHGIQTDLKAFTEAGRKEVLTDKIIVDTSVMYDTIYQHALHMLVQLIDIPEPHAYHNAANDAWYVSQCFKKLVRIT